MTDTEAMNQIRNILSGKVWDPDMLDAIADMVEQTGRTIEAPSDESIADMRAEMETGEKP